MARLNATCPHCDHVLKLHDPAESGRQHPEAGDLCLCVLCNSLSCYDDAMQLQKVGPDEVHPAELAYYSSLLAQWKIDFIRNHPGVTPPWTSPTIN